MIDTSLLTNQAAGLIEQQDTELTSLRAERAIRIRQLVAMSSCLHNVRDSHAPLPEGVRTAASIALILVEELTKQLPPAPGGE